MEEQLSLDLKDHIERARGLVDRASKYKPQRFVLKRTVSGTIGLFTKEFDFYGSKSYDFLGHFTKSEADEVLAFFRGTITKEYTD